MPSQIVAAKPCLNDDSHRPSLVPALPVPEQPVPLSKLELQAIADLWAAQFGHDPLLALHPDVTAEWFRAVVGWNNVNDADAAEIRLRCIEQCNFVQDRRRLRLVPRVSPVTAPETPLQMFAELIGDPEYDLRDFHRLDVRDEPRNRESRAAFFSVLPGRIHVGFASTEDAREPAPDAPDSLQHQTRRFQLLIVSAIAGMIAVAFLL